MPDNEKNVTPKPSMVPPEDLQDFASNQDAAWKSYEYGPKADVERYLVEGSGYFPQRIVIPRVIIPIDDRKGVESYLHTGIADRKSMGIRSIADKTLFGGGKLPWELEIDSNEKIQRFMTETLPQWIDDAHMNNFSIRQLILMANPPEIGTKSEQPNQFVFRLGWNTYHDLRSRLITEITFGTNQLRVLDRRMDVEPERIVRLQTYFTPTGCFESNEFSVGRLCVCPDKLDTANAIDSFIMGLVVDPGVRLLHRMDFFASQGLHMLEFQGYKDPGINIPKMFIYGLRGDSDETVTGLRPG